MSREARTCDGNIFNISCIKPEGHKGPHQIPSSAMFTRPQEPEPSIDSGAIGKK
jgi:hypothetical protein